MSIYLLDTIEEIKTEDEFLPKSLFYSSKSFVEEWNALQNIRYEDSEEIEGALHPHHRHGGLGEAHRGILRMDIDDPELEDSDDDMIINDDEFSDEEDGEGDQNLSPSNSSLEEGFQSNDDEQSEQLSNVSFSLRIPPVGGHYRTTGGQRE